MKLLFTFILLSSVCLGQSKKEQIITLNKRVDSLNTVLSTTRDNSVKDISSLNDKIKEISAEVTALKSDLTNVQTSNNKLTEENDKLKTDLGELSRKNLELEGKLKILEDKADNLITGEGIGKVKLGMTVKELKTFSIIKIEESYNRMSGMMDEDVECILKNGEVLKLTLTSTSPKKVSAIWTKSLYFKTPNGCKVGMTVRELKTISPDFTTFVGTMDYGYFISISEYENIWMNIGDDEVRKNNDGMFADEDNLFMEVPDAKIGEIGIKSE